MMPLGRTFRVLLASLFAAAGAPAAGATTPGPSGALTVVVENLRSERGVVQLALWNGAEGFTKREAALAILRKPAENGKVRFVFLGLPPGRYAFASFHDENANDTLDQTWIGWPKEGLGFSNAAWISVLGAPSFKAAAIEVAAGAQTIVIALRY
jgi:uncharacterized protein (DUF2141 family)